MKRLAAFAVLTFALAGCGGGSDSESSSPSETTPAVTQITCQPPADAALTPRKSAPAEPGETAYLTNVAMGSGDCSENVTFEFEAPGSGFDVSYQPESVAKTEDASGNPVPVAGSAYLVVKLSPTMTAKLEGDQLTKTYTGPRRLDVDDNPIVRDVVKTGDFESVVTWVIGLDRKRAFTTSTSDAKLVVQIDRS